MQVRSTSQKPPPSEMTCEVHWLLVNPAAMACARAKLYAEPTLVPEPSNVWVVAGLTESAARAVSAVAAATPSRLAPPAADQVVADVLRRRRGVRGKPLTTPIRRQGVWMHPVGGTSRGWLQRGEGAVDRWRAHRADQPVGSYQGSRFRRLILADRGYRRNGRTGYHARIPRSCPSGLPCRDRPRTNESAEVCQLTMGYADGHVMASPIPTKTHSLGGRDSSESSDPPALGFRGCVSPADLLLEVLSGPG